MRGGVIEEIAKKLVAFVGAGQGSGQAPREERLLVYIDYCSSDRIHSAKIER